MSFENYEFGFADAEKEYTRVPKIFENAFYDSRNTVVKLIDEHYFLLIGRKGVGKSAVSAKIQSLADKEANLFALPMQLNDFEFSTFAKTSIDKDLIGTQKYKESWDFILLLMSYKVVHNNLKVTESNELNNMIQLLDVLGFPLDIGYKKDVTRLSKLKIGNNIASFDIEFEREFGTKPSTYLERISTLNEKMLMTLSDVWYNEKKVIILIDGVDDILRFKKNQLEILSSLIRSVDYLNDKLLSLKVPIKIVLFIREDIVNNVTDPDLNKIKRDGAIILNWNNRLDDLKSIVNLRFEYSGISKLNVIQHWEKIFPRVIKDKKSWTYILDHTLYKPRDILQFLKSCQELYPNNTKLTFSEVRNVLKTYSREYFIEEMKNEITGFINDEHINILPSVLQKIGERSFSFIEFSRMMEEQGTNENIKDSNIKYLLLLLFEAGYIGHLIANTRNSGSSVIFKYRNGNAQIDYSQKFLTHKGLYNGLGVKGV
ncbi:P-loop ATPase, Sll1717 family [Sutcliffiella horikoshii]|uniref:P-loop ATPase, Sll1717 family n=1 Tax=Sutcliffiella horikoshii TaxID=79883 RepID=UPI003CED6630